LQYIPKRNDREFLRSLSPQQNTTLSTTESVQTDYIMDCPKQLKIFTKILAD